MQRPHEFYTIEKQQFEEQVAVLKKQLITSGTLRLLVFLLTVLGSYLWFENFKAMILIALMGTAVFVYLLLRHTNLQYKRELTRKLIQINQIELNALKGDYTQLDEGSEFVDPTHFYSYDIDLFGRGSFFQYINRTATNQGKKKLASLLTSNDISIIQKKQESIKELSKKPKWRQQFSAIASLVKIQHSAKAITLWMTNYKAVFPVFMAYIPFVFSIISVTLITLLSFGMLPFSGLLIWFFIGLGISGVYFKKVNTIYLEADKAKGTFKQYHKLLNEIETEAFSTELLREKQQEIKTEKLKASVIFKKFSKVLDALDQRNNVIIAVLGNAFFLRDIHEAFKVEKWILQYASKVENWFKVIAFFDAYNSLANVAFNHPDYVFPRLKENKCTIKAEMLGHPLLKAAQRVDNDFNINKQQFYIITGANMAGKSTFLRTVSLAVVMANTGLPVCAASFEYVPVKLITSMRTSDSLVDDESYFFSELKRLKFIVEEIKNADYFIILDEILKGTNSTDKAIGSKKFVQKLVASNATGIIATHDLSLCEIENELQEIKNCYFDAEIINNELYFDYQLKNGVCKNMNASFLLKKMEII